MIIKVKEVDEEESKEEEEEKKMGCSVYYKVFHFLLLRDIFFFIICGSYVFLVYTWHCRKCTAISVLLLCFLSTFHCGPFHENSRLVQTSKTPNLFNISLPNLSSPLFFGTKKNKRESVRKKSSSDCGTSRLLDLPSYYSVMRK